MSAWNAPLLPAIRRFRLHAATGGGVAILVLMVAAAYPLCGGVVSWLRPAVVALCLVALAQSVHLLFDAALFRLAASHETEAAGLSAVDRTLAAMGLRTMPEAPAPLAARLGGTRRIARRQYATLGLGVLLLLLDTNTGTLRC